MAKRGRPSFKPTPRLRRTVEEMLACGETQNTIARAIGCDPDTLRKHFAEELLNGNARRRREVVEMLFRAARKGNVSAQKKLEDMTSLAPPPNPPAPQHGEAASETKAPKLGKKEQAQLEAEQGAQGTTWGGLLN